MKRVIVLMLSVVISACVTSPPRHIDNICHIFDEKSSWYKKARKASKRWDVPIAVNMAIMHQESRFQPKAKPPRTKILWVIPGPRKSSAYGYSQAKKETWRWYQKESGNGGADRDNFADAVDFVAWYNHISKQRLRIANTDAYALYLAYHEGHGGYTRSTWKKKDWLQKVAHKVSARAGRYQQQLNKCEKRLNSSWWWPF